jgi:ring-1,2-phenylacetyl-CoA epoxidase subunit PaaE
MTPKFHSLKVQAITKETKDSVTISFTVPTELKTDYSFYAGQYLTLRAQINGEDVRRSYSLCSAPTEKTLKVVVKKIENGVFSTFANDQLNVGDQLDVMTPAGNFYLKPNPTAKKYYALYAAGSGITPIISIAKTILAEEKNSEVSLFYGNKTIDSIIFKEDIEAMKNLQMKNFRIVHVLSRENLGNPLQKGRIDKEKSDLLYKAFYGNQGPDAAYLCGPEEMILAVKDSLIENGVPAENVHFELFTSSKAKKAAPISNEPKIDSNVSIILDGDQFDLAMESDGETILDAAQKAGADLPYACKGGVCCTCKAKIISGTARMDVNYALEKDEVEAGFILTCQAHPTSEKLIVSFDE